MLGARSLPSGYNAVVEERFFGSLKLKIAQPTREHMRNDVAAYMRYYNLDRLHTVNGDQSPINYGESALKSVRDGLTSTKMSSLITLKYNTISDAADEFGSVPGIRGVFIGFQRYLYE